MSTSVNTAPLGATPNAKASRLSRTIGYLRYRFPGWLSFAVITIIAILTLAPAVWILSTSLRKPIESFNLPPEWIPSNPNFNNFAEVFERIPFWNQILNSAIVTSAIVVGQVFSASLAGYAFACLRFPGKNMLFSLILATLMIPLQATIIPVFILLTRLNLSDTLFALILPAIPTAYGTFLLRQYFMVIPKDFEEAAIMDGANMWQVFFRVYLPLATPGMAVLSVLSFNGYWNEFFRPLIFLTTQNRRTIPLGLVDLQGYLQTGSISVVLAGIVLSAIPVIIIYVIGQRYLIEGIMRGGVKG
jgi:multiple sugar transport system permease protein